MAFGLDHADYLTMRAPKPTLLCVGTRDFFDIQGSWDTFREVKLIYGRLGFGERVDLFESDEPHGFTGPRRVASARWMRRWLLEDDDAITEPDLPIAHGAPSSSAPRPARSSATSRASRSSTSTPRTRAAASSRIERSFAARARRPRFATGSRDCWASRTGRPQPGSHSSRGTGPLCVSGQQRLLSIETEPGIVITAIELVPGLAGRDSARPLVKLGVDQVRELEPGGPVDSR